MASDRVVVNAGGRRFETTTTTLVSSGSAYFSALLGYTGSALGSLPRSSNENDSSVAITPHQNGRKRSRKDGGEDEDATERRPAAVKELFIDRDPDLFGHVLYFMRSTRLPSKVRKDMDQLDDLKDEALFFGFQELESACEKALKELRDALQEALKPEPKLKAKCYTIVVESDDFGTLFVPKGEVLFVASATLAGRVRSRRYKPSDEVMEERRENGEDSDMDEEAAVEHCYLDPSLQGDSGDFQLEASVSGGQRISIAHVAIDYSTGIDKFTGMNLDFRQDIRLCLAPFENADNRSITFFSKGSGDWHLVCWVGEASAIPQLNSGNTDTTSQKFTRIRKAMHMAAANGGVASNASLASALTVAAFALLAASLF